MPDTSRRTFLKTSSALAGAAVLVPSLQGLVSCARWTQEAPGNAGTPPRRAARGQGGYGLLRRAGTELALPAGFTYRVLSYTGKPMSDGSPTPGAFDGMAAFPLPNGNVRLIRNHENRDLAVNARCKGDLAKAYDRKGGGGTTSLEVRIGSDGKAEVVRDFVSLNGTIVNCAGGPTPWGTWLSCEESTDGRAQGWEQEHGYVFEVPASAEDEVTPVPLKAMGRFVHEAVAVDPRTGVVYETEDRQIAGFYRFVPRTRGVLAEGGRLEMLAVTGRPNWDTGDGQRVGERLPVHWVPIDVPDPSGVWGDTSAVFSQGFTKGGARFARLEGCWWGDGGVVFHATNGGDAKLGQVWFYRPLDATRGELTLIFESPSADVLDYPDNVTVSPRGGIVICEDGSGEQMIRGLTREGRIFDFAQNLLNRTEFAGACFSPDGRTLFLNIMGSTTDAGPLKGVTVAIRGPWEDGAL
ncbi:MAG TPA: alkaline phosphatase PhoX [Gemmatimonadaceae bacterium]|nr:alkaline phosphatase PhoX [Gemmatimonadaceae bacterium]